MNAEQLKNSILQRAIEGKLVEQRALSRKSSSCWQSCLPLRGETCRWHVECQPQADG